MAGNVWEWQANYRTQMEGRLSLRGGSWYYYQDFARVSGRFNDLPSYAWCDSGFRVVFAPPSALL
jgi:formylglycine-generating enzyme required for sulfatase activity